MFVKICGITRTTDAELACELGASAIGLVFWPGSRRAVTQAAARDIVRVVPCGVMTIGVFVNEDAEVVNDAAAQVGLHAVQLHGTESPEYCGRIKVPVIKAVPLRATSAFTAACAVPARCTVLLDTFDPAQPGGTGRTGDWTTAAEVARRRPVILAGGLHAGNVRAAISAVGPYGVDVSSGVEAAPGVKDSARLRAFFEAMQGNGRQPS